MYAGSLHLAAPTTYKYLNQSGCYTLPGEDLQVRFKELKEAFTASRLSEEEQYDVLATLSSVLVRTSLL
jgi:myosin heavy subunit